MCWDASFVVTDGPGEETVPCPGTCLILLIRAKGPWELCQVTRVMCSEQMGRWKEIKTEGGCCNCSAELRADRKAWPCSGCWAVCQRSTCLQVAACTVCGALHPTRLLLPTWRSEAAPSITTGFGSWFYFTALWMPY